MKKNPIGTLKTTHRRLNVPTWGTTRFDSHAPISVRDTFARRANSVALKPSRCISSLMACDRNLGSLSLSMIPKIPPCGVLSNKKLPDRGLFYPDAAYNGTHYDAYHARTGG